MPTLARLSFWVSPEQMDKFEAAYEKKLVPILNKHDLAESSERGRSTVECVFSRLFEVETPSEVVAKERALRKDPAWQEVLRSLGTAFGTTESNGLLRTHLGLYRTPVGPGKTVEAGPGFRQGPWQSFGVRDGLPASLIPAILQDREGHLWLTTGLSPLGAEGRGVCRYDGERFTTFTTEDGLVNNTVRAILEDREGHLWFGTEEGVSRYDAHRPDGAYRCDRGEFVTFTTEDGLASNNVCVILEDREGRLWFGTWGGGMSRYDAHRPDGAYRCDRGEFVTFTTEDGLASNNVLSISEDWEGHLWFGTEEGVSRYDGERFATFTTEDGLASNNVLSISEDWEGHLWFGTEEGVSRYDGEAFVTLTTQDGLADNHVRCILEDRAGHLWFATWSGVSRYDGEQFVTFTTEDGLADNWVRCILEDQEGDLWFGTYGGGVSRYDGEHVTIFTTKDGLGNVQARVILEDREGLLWVGTFGGVSRYDGERFVTFTTQDGLAGDVLTRLLEDREGHLWLGTWDGVSRYDGEHFVTFTTEEGLANNNVQSILEDREGHLWFGTYGGGVSRYDGERFVTFTTEEGLAHNSVVSILEDREGHLWFGTLGGGVSRYDAHRGDGEQFVTFTTQDGLAGDVVRAILEDREGHLWFGTWSGVSRYDGEQFLTFTAEDGLAHDSVMSMLEDREGHLWFGTWGGGVSRYDGLVFQSLSRKDGLVHDTIRHILQARHGELWIGTEGGLTRYRPRHTPPAVRVTDVVADRRYGPVPEIHLPVSQKLLAFEFRGWSWTTRPDGMAYVVRLEGYDPGWKPIYTRRMEYQDLPLGEYTFQVKAVDRDLNYSEPATVRVTVEPDPHLEALTDALSASGPRGEFVGESDALRRVQTQLREVAPMDLTVLILGETGTGKGLAARTLHEWSTRASGPFVQVHCGAIPETLVESELFGHEKGAFTGAISRKLGKVELAKGGTLFLDEIGDMPLEAQVKLLRLLEERTFERVGGTETLQADVRILAATNRNLQQMVKAGTFRDDLYFRLQVFPVQLPPLRERREDIPLLAIYFMQRMAAHLNKGQITQLTPQALSVLRAHDWPGNVRELEHAVSRAVVVCPGPAIRAEDITLGVGTPEEGSVEEVVTPEEYERRYLRRMLEKAGWVIKGPHGAAALLGMPPSTLHARMKKLGIVRP